MAEDTLSGVEVILGGSAGDSFTGDAAANTFRGYAGADVLTGGGGADVFTYGALSDSTVAAAGRDHVTDFSRADGDKLDLRALDAVAGGTDDAFSLVAAFTGVAGQLVSAADGGGWRVQGDVNGDGAADFAIAVTAATALAAGDFLL